MQRAQINVPEYHALRRKSNAPKIAPMYRENHTVQHEKKRRNMCRTMVAPWSRVCNAARNNRWWSNTGRRPVQNPQDKSLAFPWHKRQNKLLKYVDPIHQTCASVGNYRFFETKHCGVNKNAPVVRGVRGKEKSAMSGEHCKCQELQCVHVEWHCEEKAFLEQNRAKTAPQIDAIDFWTATKSNHAIKQPFLHLQSSSFAQRVLLKQIDLFNGSKHCSQSIHGPKQIHWSVSERLVTMKILADSINTGKTLCKREIKWPTNMYNVTSNKHSHNSQKQLGHTWHKIRFSTNTANNWRSSNKKTLPQTHWPNWT